MSQCPNGDYYYGADYYNLTSASTFTASSSFDVRMFVTYYQVTARDNQDMPNCPFAGKCSRAGSHSCTECGENEDVEKGDFFKPAKKEESTPLPPSPFNPSPFTPQPYAPDVYPTPYAPDVYPTPYVPEYPPDGTWVPRKYWYRTGTSDSTTDTTYYTLQS